MKTNTKNDIFEFIIREYPIWVSSIANKFSFSNQIIHRHLNKLIEEWKIYKTWNPPKVYYFPNNFESNPEVNISEKDINFLNKNFIEFTPDWKVLYWISWFDNWCKKRWHDTIKELELYKVTLNKYNKFKNKDWFIDWIQKMQSTFEHVYLDEVYYLDFYSIEKYWKTLLWNLMLYWKQTADKHIISEILTHIKPSILMYINKNNIDSYAFIPPSIYRKIQILDEIKRWLSLKLKELKLLKIFKDKIVSQKSLSKKEDRIINASQTIFLWDKNFKANKMLLIDDAIWSGSTLNETAKKIKDAWISNYVIWIAIVWSYKWFEVINEI